MPKCNELSKDDVTNVTIFQEFGSYLVDVAHEKLPISLNDQNDVNSIASNSIR